MTSRFLSFFGRAHVLGAALAALATCSLPASAQTQADIALWDSTWAQYQALESVPRAARAYLSATQVISTVIRAPLKQVYRIYSDVNNALGLHPYLKSVQPIRRADVNGVPTFDFIAYEDIPVLGTVIHGVTIAQQRFHPEADAYDVDTYDAPGVVTHQHITFTQVAGGTKVTERLTFEATLPYIAVSAIGGVYAHKLVQIGLKKRIESGYYQQLDQGQGDQADGAQLN
jgi:hypothetical protein